MIDELTHFARGQQATATTGETKMETERKTETERELARKWSHCRVGEEVRGGGVSKFSEQASHMSKLTDVINHFMPLQTIFNEGYRRL